MSKLFVSKETASLEIPSSLEHFKEKIIGLLPRKLVCCHKKRKQKALESARVKLLKEVDIIEMIRSKRFVDKALKHLLGEKLHKELKSKS